MIHAQMLTRARVSSHADQMLRTGSIHKMPHACLLFDDATDASMRACTAELAAHAAFQPETLPLHVPLVGSLHNYSEDHIRRALKAQLSPIVGRFVKWEINGRAQLRATVELADADAITQAILKDLPAGQRWRSHYVVLGSVAAIDKEQHANFLAAMQQAFPIDGTTTFTVAEPRLEYHTPPKQQPEVRTRDPAAPAAKAGGRQQQRQQQKKKQGKQQQKKSQQQQQQQRQTPAQTAGVSKRSRKLQAKTASALLQTGNILRKTALCKSVNQATKRAMAVQKARERGVASLGQTA